MKVWNNWVKVLGEWYHTCTVAASPIFDCVWKTVFIEFGHICSQACKTRVCWHKKFSKLLTLTVIKQSKYTWLWHLTGFITQVTEFEYSFAILRYVLMFRCECSVSTGYDSQNSWCTYQVYKMVEKNNFYFN